MDTDTSDFLVSVAIRAVIDDTPDGAWLERVHRAAIARSTAADWEGMAVLAARRAGASWSEIGAAIGISKQAAQQRYT